jgi:hypothetical protein
MSITTLVGLVLYAYYATCDPLTAGHIKKRDEVGGMQLVDILKLH